METSVFSIYNLVFIYLFSKIYIIIANASDRCPSRMLCLPINVRRKIASLGSSDFVTEIMSFSIRYAWNFPLVSASFLVCNFL